MDTQNLLEFGRIDSTLVRTICPSHRLFFMEANLLDSIKSSHGKGLQSVRPTEKEIWDEGDK